jgi:hypothetical protein
MNHQIDVEILSRFILPNKIFMAVLFFLKFTEYYVSNS